jgi:hypothetical protein
MKPMTRGPSKDRPRPWPLAAATLFAVLTAAAAQPQNTTPQPIPAPQTPQDLVDALHTAFGEHQREPFTPKVCSSKAASQPLSRPGR